MATVSKGKKEVKDKKYGIDRFINSWKYSLDGLKYAYTHEQSLLLHVTLSIVAIIMGLCFKITGIQWILLIIVMSMLMVTELLNTAIEATIDLVTEEYHPMAKVAKDCGSAAALIGSLLATIIAGYVFIPHIIKLIGGA